MQNNRKKSGLGELKWLAGVLLALIFFFFPIFAEWHGIFIDDVRTFSFPNAVFQARYIKQGVIPLWDPHTFAGGVPFLTRLDAFTFYPPQWLAGLLGNSTDPDRSYRELMLIPILLHYLWGALGGFVLGRWGMGLSRPAAAALALTFTLSSSMIGAMLNPPMVMSLPWHPWLAAAVLLYIQRPGSRRLLLGAVIFALAIPSWSNYVTHGVFLAILFALAGLSRRFISSGPAVAGRILGGLAVMVIVAGLLTAPYLVSLLEATGYVQATIPLDYNFITDGPRSVPWRWLATIFVPELFASTNFASMWGVAEEQKMYWCEAMMTRGMLLWLPAALTAWAGLLAALRRLRDRRGLVSTLDGWSWFATGLVVLSLFLLLGRHTPIFGVLYRFCPLFRIPYATRWHTTLTMGLAVLTGIGVNRLLDERSGSFLATRRRLVTYLSLTTLVALGAVALPFGYWARLTDLGWFLKNPLLYWGVCAFALVFLSLRWKPSRVIKTVVILALLDLVRNAALDTYRPIGVAWAPEQDPGRRPSETALYTFMARAATYDKDPMFRTGYSRVFTDAGALLYGGNSLLGVGVKPMPPRLYSTLAKITTGMPNQTVLSDPTLRFVRNMSTGFWWYDRSRSLRPDWASVTAAPEFGLYLFRVPDPLPRVFTLDRLEPAEEEDQRRALIGRDLHGVVVINATDEIVRRHLAGREGPSPEGEMREHFSRLQKANRLTRSDFSHPHRVELDVAVSVPAMLVMTDAWHPGWVATDNDRKVTIHRVNHIQRGIWLEAGFHRVRLEFRPAAVTVGRWFTLAGLAAGVFLFLWQRRPAFGQEERK